MELHEYTSMVSAGLLGIACVGIGWGIYDSLYRGPKRAVNKAEDSFVENDSLENYLNNYLSLKKEFKIAELNRGLSYQEKRTLAKYRSRINPHIPKEVLECIKSGSADEVYVLEDILEDIRG